jgi:hypothetical protein
MIVNDLIKKLEALRSRDLNNGDLPVVLGLTGGTLLDEVFIEYYEGDAQLPCVRICSVNDDRVGAGSWKIA